MVLLIAGGTRYFVNNKLSEEGSNHKDDISHPDTTNVLIHPIKSGETVERFN